MRLHCIGRHAKRVQKLGFMDQKKAPDVYVERLETHKDQSEKAHWIRCAEKKGI